MGLGNQASDEWSDPGMDDSEEVSCPKCMGVGYFADCFDDMCHGREECVHGDDTTCTVCGGDGFVIWRPASPSTPESNPNPNPKEK